MKVDISIKSGICTYTTILLTILVVMGHVTRMYSGRGLFSPDIASDDVLSYVTNLLYAFHMPAFMAVSGAVFSLCINDLGKYHNPNKFITNKLRRLIVPYYTFLFLLVIPIMLYIGKLEMGGGKILINCILLMGDGRHLWFLPVLCGCLMIMYLLRKYLNKFPLYILIATLISWCVSFKLPYVHPVISAVLYYLVFFYIGYLILSNIDTVCFIKSWWFIAVTFISIVLLCNFTNHIVLKFILNIIGIFFSFGCGWHLYKITRHNKLIESLSRNSFGIYLFHPLLIYLTFYWLIKFDISINPYVFTPALIVAVILLSTLLSELCRQLRVGFVIGESGKSKK